MARTIRKYFRVSADELKEMNARKGNMRTSIFVRHCVLGSRPLSVPAVNNDLLVELRKIGTNLNQIAKKLNSSQEKIEQEIAATAAEECQNFRNAIIRFHTFNIEFETEK